MHRLPQREARILILALFIAKWQASLLTERSAAQSHFLDLCRVLSKPEPSSDPTGENYAFEKSVGKVGGKGSGGTGFADVWMRGHFAWEYKGKRKNLADAYDQLLQYREELGNPPLLVVCDLDRFEVHTNFTNTAKRVFAFTLADLSRPEPTSTCALPPLDVLRALFEDPNRLRPEQTTAAITQEAARGFGRLALSLQEGGHDPHSVSRFLIRVLFCLFAEDVGLLPPNLFTTLVEKTKARPGDFAQRLGLLFAAMTEGGGFGADDIKHFNGGLFNDAEVLSMTPKDLATLAGCARLGWENIEPSIFGTLFERSLDPSKRSQLGAHYTSREDILLIVEPVLMAPLRRRWEEVQTQAQTLIDKRNAVPTPAARNKISNDLNNLLQGFSEELAAVRVLDPACGSGNFLYVALRALLDLEKDVITFAIAHDAGGFFPRVGPEQMRGMELNDYAHELAPITVWIGYIQWLKDNGFGQPAEPILRQIDTIWSQDAILAFDADGKPVEPAWPEADVIIGNPPFLGGNRIRQELGDQYVEALFKLYEGRVPAFADLVCYWFERSRFYIAESRVKRAGLLATQGIRAGANRKVLERINATGSIFWAQSDRDWILTGATVHVSMIGFDNGFDQSRLLNGQSVPAIYADLTATIDLTAARVLPENLHISYQGPSPKAPFDLDRNTGLKMLEAPININGRPNSDVVRAVASAIDLVQRSREKWTIDFASLPMELSAEYEAPFEYVKTNIYPLRSKNRRESYAEKWWQYAEARPGMRLALKDKTRYIATPRVSKHRIFVWLMPNVLANDGTIVFARSDDYAFGILHSHAHELWARGKGSQLREAESGFRYTPSSTFETFPFPWPPGKEPVDDPKVKAIAEAARILVEKRDAWLNPEGAAPAELAKRTLTNLYNARPAWLDNLHKTLNQAVFAAYGWPVLLTDAELLEHLLALNLERSQP